MSLHHAVVTPTRQNAILEAIERVGLDPRDFDWGREPTQVTQVGPGQEPMTVDLLVHAPTGYWFKFDVQEPRGTLWAIREPGPDGPQRRDHAGNWDYTFGYVRQWLGYVKEEHDAPDLWAELAEQRELMIGEAVENTPFTADEQAQIAEQLTEAKENLRANFDLEPERLERIERQLDYLVDAAKRAPRIDWRNLLVGSLLSLVIQKVVPVAPLQHLLFMVFRGLAQLFGGGPPELPGAA